MKQSPNACPVFALLVVAAAFGFIMGMYYIEDTSGVPRAHNYIPLASRYQQVQQLLSQTQTAELAHNLDLPKVWPFAPEQPRWAFKGVLKPPVAEGEMDLIPLCNASFVEQHPLSDSDYARSYTPGEPCRSLPPGLLQKIQSGQAVRIVVVGGSMTQGRRCFDGKRSWQSCAWSSRLEDRLREVFSGKNITVHNAALPGFSYGHWLSSGMLESLTEADVVVIDEQVNSHQYGFNAFTQMEAVDEFLFGLLAAAQRRQRDIGVLFMESFRTCANDSAVCDQLCGSTKKGHQGDLTTSIKGHNTTWHWCNRWWSAADIERPVVRHYGFPIASYRDAVWPKLNHPRPDLPCMWNGKSHPDSITHSLIGDVIAYGLIRALLDSSTSGNQQCDTSPQPKMFHPQMETIEYCAPPDADEPSTAVSGTFMSAFQPSVFEPVVSGGWYWREDVPGKPGWIFEAGYVPSANTTATTGPAPSRRLMLQESLAAPASNNSSDNATIWFKVYLGKQVQLQVTYLVSYLNIGSVEVSIHPLSALETLDSSSTALAKYTIDAKNPDAVSVPKTVLFVHPASNTTSRTKALGQRLPATVGQGYHLVAFRPLSHVGKDAKFKLLGIASC